MTRSTIFLFLSLGLVLGFSGNVSALVVTGNFTGSITEIHEDIVGLAPAVSPGDPVVGTYTYDTTQATLYASIPTNPQSIWEFPASALSMTVTVGANPTPQDTWTVFGPKPDVSLRSTVNANPFQNEFVLQAKTASPAAFPNLPPGTSSVGYGRFILRGSAGMVNNGALALPTQPSDIDLSFATHTHEGMISARPHPFIYDQGWFFTYDIESHIVGIPGVHQDLPILPSNADLNPDGSWEFGNVPGDGNWFDPPLVDSYRYETDGQSNFIGLILPTGIDDDGQFTVTDASGTTTVPEGMLHTFAIPTTQFTVSGISPLVDGGDPRAFPTYLSFDEATVNFTQTPVPEPSTLVLLSMGAVGLLAYAWRKRKRAV